MYFFEWKKDLTNYFTTQALSGSNVISFFVAIHESIFFSISSKFLLVSSIIDISHFILSSIVNLGTVSAPTLVKISALTVMMISTITRLERASFLLPFFTEFFVVFHRIFKGVFTPYHFQYAYFYTGEGPLIYRGSYWRISSAQSPINKVATSNLNVDR